MDRGWASEAGHGVRDVLKGFGMGGTMLTLGEMKGER